MQDCAETERDGKSPKMLAVLIDADNISYQHAPRIFHIVWELAGRLGVEKPVCKAYGNLNSFSGDRSWRKGIDEYGVEACPQISLLEQKNVADIALILDAMELWASGGCAGMVIVSSDSDFTFLVRRLRDRGMRVYVIGNDSSVLSLRRSCEQFFELPPLSSMVAIPEQVTIGEPEKHVREVVVEPCPESKKFSMEEAVVRPELSTASHKPTGFTKAELKVERERLIDMLKRRRCHELSGCLDCLPDNRRSWFGYLLHNMVCQKLIRYDLSSGIITWT